MNRDIKGSKAIFLFPLTNHKYLNVYGQCRFRKKKSPTFCNKTVFCFFLPLSDRKRKMPLSISLALSRQINSLFALGVTSCTGGQEVFCAAEAAWQALSMHCEFYMVFNRSGKRFYQVPKIVAHKGGKTETEQCWGKTENLVLLYFVVRRSQMMSMCGVTISSCLLYVSIQMKRVYKYKLCPKIIHAP